MQPEKIEIVNAAMNICVMQQYIIGCAAIENRE